MQGLRSNRNDIPDLNSFGFRPLLNPSKFPQLESRIQRNVGLLRPKPTSSSATLTETAVPQRSNISQTDKDFLEEALKIHNEFRKRHGVGPLRLNNDLNKLAQAWGRLKINNFLIAILFLMNFLVADHLASTGSLIHSKTKYRNVNIGENLRCQSWPITGCILFLF